MLAQQREDRVVCVALHARSEQTEVPDVVPVAVGDVIGQDSQELAWRVGGLDYLLSARVPSSRIGFLDRQSSGTGVAQSGDVGRSGPHIPEPAFCSDPA